MRQILFAYLQLDGRGVTPGAGALRDWSAAYLSDLPALGAADHVTDKHPLNFEAVPLIVQLFPQSTIVHVRRDPMETCLSIYRQEFNKHWAFAHRLEDIGHFYGHYARLVAHWERRFPDRFVTIQYESFAADFENAAPTLLKQCGLALGTGVSRLPEGATRNCHVQRRAGARPGESRKRSRTALRQSPSAASAGARARQR